MLNKISVIYAVCSYIWERNFVDFLYVLNFSPHEHYKTDKEIEYTEFLLLLYDRFSFKLEQTCKI